MTSSTAPISTVCSGCMEDVKIRNGVATVRVASNGRRGSLYVAAHDVTADVFDDGDLLTWDCPACEYADSYDLHQ